MRVSVAIRIALGSFLAIGLASCGSGKQTQTVSFSSKAPASVTAGVGSYDASARASSGLAVHLRTQGACSIANQARLAGTPARSATGASSPAKIDFVGVGGCTIFASQQGDNAWEQAHQVTQSITVLPNSPGVGEAAREDAALEDAKALLTTLPLPAGAENVGSDPVPGRLNARGAPEEGYRTVARRFWRVPGEPTAFLAWLEAHKLPGASRALPSRRFAGGKPIEWFLEYALKANASQRLYIGSEQLELSLAAAPGGGTGLRADAEVAWIARAGQSAKTPTF